MKRVFLSHSSADKGFYIENVVKNLTKLIGPDKFIYDAKTFEEGQETAQEITRWLENTEIFVLFISDTALDSEWVKKEILEAKDLLDKNELSKIYPIIIDNSITHEDPRIPDWLRRTYNIRYISQSGVAARKIHNRLIEVIWEKHPNIKQKSTLFVGRNSLINNIEERMDSYEKSIPTTLIASGLKDIGRRSLLRRSLIKSSLISESYHMPSISLDAHQSIEDFILFLNDIGHELDEKTNLITLSQNEKVKIAVRMLKELKSSKDILLIIDEGAIVSPTRKINDWFITLNNKLSEEYIGMTMCVVSKYRTNFNDLSKAESIHSIHVPELTVNERNGLFTRYSRLLELHLGKEDNRFVTTFFSGLPTEIIFIADYIKSNSIEQLKRNTAIITDFSDSRVSNIISYYDGNNEAHNLLSLIATFDFVSYSMLNEIIADSEEYHMLIEEFLTKGICENLGINNEYLCLNSAIKNYIQRQKLDLDEEFKKSLEKHVKAFVDNYDETADKDVSDIFFSLRKAIIGNHNIDNRFLIPSHYLKSMKELYDKRDKDQDVVNLADRILNNEEFMDAHIAREIRFFLCSSLARLKDERFKMEVQKIKGPEHSFLFGFYYRHVGRDTDAINSLLKALEERPNFGRAKRELVLVYNNIEEYDKALNLAKDNYESNKNNEYHIQAYFQCLSYGKSEKLTLEEKRERVKTLLSDIKRIDSEKAKSMSLVMNIQYKVYFDEDLLTAEQLIEDMAYLYPKDIFVLLSTFDVYEKLNNLNKMKEILEKIRSLHGNHKSKYHRDYLKSLAVVKAAEGNITEAENLLKKINISENGKSILKHKIDKYSNKKKMDIN
ncbi:TIR domain-containing protein [Planococcus maritimus]|uniref:TIR domain-containing protein n=1 Tax=Planococcus maritimus TaxID=192421 RepID=A0A7D7R1L6_PLAMR|nr:toll/interleukin-1 receptor domain-containing protein [Planococcus maritimus]QMT18076.1 TIR domain-containing protein [Planococcus maritimus]